MVEKQLEQNIKKKIREKKKNLAKLKKAQGRISKEQMDKFEKDWGFWNSLNPFYRKQYNPNKDFIGIMFFATQQARLEGEIKELTSLLNTSPKKVVRK